MKKYLPSRPNLDQLKNQAKTLLKSYKSGNPDAIQRIKESHPRFAKAAEDHIRTAKFLLSDAQLVVAREHAFPSWPRLKEHVEQTVLVPKLHDAARRGDLETVKRILRTAPKLVRSEVSGSDEHQAIHFAAREGHLEVVNLLMERGADPLKGVYPFRAETTARDRKSVV